MKKIGKPVEFPILEKVEDLVYYDGPLLSLFKRTDEEIFYFYYWMDVDETSNRWMIFEVSKEDINHFKNEDSDQTLFDLFSQAENLWIDDISDGLDDLIHDIRIVEKKDIVDFYNSEIN